MSLNNAADEYLQNMVFTATPARLRLLLITKAVDLCTEILGTQDESQQPEKLLHLREVLGELLTGVNALENALTRHVSDLYVFLIQELTKAETLRESWRIEPMKRVLMIEQETWQQVCNEQSSAPRGAPLAPHLGSVPTSFSFDA